MAYFKNIYETVNGACPDDDCEYIELEDCVTFEEFDLFATSELTTQLECLQESTDSTDREKAETIVDVLRKRGCDIKPNCIEDAYEYELEDYSMDELKKYQDNLWFQLAGRAATLGEYLNSPNIVAEGKLIKKLEGEIAKMSKRFNVVYEAWRKKAVAQEIANGNTLIAKQEEQQ